MNSSPDTMQRTLHRLHPDQIMTAAGEAKRILAERSLAEFVRQDWHTWAKLRVDHLSL